MIWLHSDCLLVRTSQGETIACSAEAVIVELVGEAAAVMDPVVMQNATKAVLHYFKTELGRDTVTVGEFATALARVLNDLGIQVQVGEEPTAERKIAELDLQVIAAESGEGFELAFFQRLRDEMRHRLDSGPHVVRFKGLRSCVKRLSGTRRWNHRCQTLNDHIVEYLRECWRHEPRTRNTALVVQ